MVKGLATVDVRLRGYFRTVIRRRHGIPWVIDFDFLARRLKLCRRTIERGVAKLRLNGAFFFEKKRDEREYYVQVSDRHRSITGVFPLRGKRIETPEGNSRAAAPPRAVSEPAESCPPTLPETPQTCFEPHVGKISALAAVLARGELKDRHWDNCKITWRFPHAFCFARRALSIGHSVAEIVRAYDFAVHERHKDATDYALNRGCEPAFWEPSSTVSLAAETLRQDGRTVDQRWREFFKQPRRPAPAVEVKTSLPRARHHPPGTVEILRAKIADRPRDLPEVTLTQLARFLERKEMTLPEFNALPYAWKAKYIDQARQFYSST